MPNPIKDTRPTEEYMSNLFKEVDIVNFLKKPIRETIKMAQPTINIPDVEEKEESGGNPATKQPERATQPPAGLPPPPSTGGLPPLPTTPTGGLPPLPTTTAPTKEDRVKKEDLLKTIDDIKEQIQDLKSEMSFSVMKKKVLDEVDIKYNELEKELNSIKSRKIPEKKYFDTEGAYRDNLYGMATLLLDEFLPELFEEIPDYNFTSTQVSRTFEDGTVADALVTLMVTVPRDGMKYDFKVQIPVLNGLMQYPMYIQRGQKIIPLTKPEIQTELDSMSYRKLDIETPYEKNNIFNNIGENIHRRPDEQKWYEVEPNTYKPVGLPPDNKYKAQRGQTR